MYYKKLFFVFALMSLFGCASQKKDFQDRSAESIEKRAFSLLRSKEYTEAAEEFKDIDTLFPYSAKAMEGQVMSAYCYFLASKYLEAINEIKVFLKYHPSHNLVPYAMYLNAVCVYMQVSSAGRDPKAALDAKEAFAELANRFPDSPYYKDSLKRIMILDDITAAHEMIVGRFYQKNKNILAAIGRYNFIVTKMPHTQFAAEAYYRLMECCSSLNLKDEAKNALESLRAIHKSSEWTKKAEAITIN